MIKNSMSTNSLDSIEFNSEKLDIESANRLWQNNEYHQQHACILEANYLD